MLTPMYWDSLGIIHTLMNPYSKVNHLVRTAKLSPDFLFLMNIDGIIWHKIRSKFFKYRVLTSFFKGGILVCFIDLYIKNRY